MHKVVVRQIRFLSTGADGGHVYIKGKGSFAEFGEVEIYAHFATKELEEQFRKNYKDGEVELIAGRFDYLKEIGVSLWDVSEWRIYGDV